MEVLVFKTNLADVDSVAEVEKHLNHHPYIHQWNVDMQDCDNVLRVVSNGIAAGEVQEIVKGVGYYCEEL